MKEKILPFIIGLLVGAIITTACFWCYSKNKETSNSENQMMGRPDMSQDGERPDFQKREMPNGFSEDGERPEMPDGEKPNGEPPTKPGENNSTENTTSEIIEEQ